MSAIGGAGRKMYFERDSKLTREISQEKYIGSVFCCSAADKTADVAAYTIGAGAVGAGTGIMIGIGVGAAAGAEAGLIAGGIAGGVAVPGIGAPPGALIGVIVGSVVGVAGGFFGGAYGASRQAKEQKDAFESYRNNCQEMVLKQLDTLISEKINDMDYMCPITQTYPYMPVKIRGEKDLYDARALKEWRISKGTSPTTRKPFTKKDIFLSVKGIAIHAKICDEILNDPIERAKYSKDFLNGLAILRRVSVEKIKNYYEEEKNDLLGKFSSGKIFYNEFMTKMQSLGEEVDPILNRVAAQAREAYDDEQKE